MLRGVRLVLYPQTLEPSRGDVCTHDSNIQISEEPGRAEPFFLKSFPLHHPKRWHQLAG